MSASAFAPHAALDFHGDTITRKRPIEFEITLDVELELRFGLWKDRRVTTMPFPNCLKHRRFIRVWNQRFFLAFRHAEPHRSSFSIRDCCSPHAATRNSV